MKKPIYSTLKMYNKEYKVDSDGYLLCPYCKNDKFFVNQTPDWETDTICTKCYKKQIAHDG